MTPVMFFHDHFIDVQLIPVTLHGSNGVLGGCGGRSQVFQPTQALTIYAAGELGTRA